jgi:hypothetical protein
LKRLAAHVIWSGIWGAVVTYHDLRVAREGVDVEAIVAVLQ